MRTDLVRELATLPPDVRARLDAYGFDDAWFLSHAARLGERGTQDNQVRGVVAAPEPGDVVDLPAPGTDAHRRASERGEAALSRGECALVVLAGGMATRMGGVVKALVEALPGKTFLDLRLEEQRALEARVGRVVPLWLMTSQATHEAIVEALGDRLDGYHIAVFPQSLSLRLTPSGELFRDAGGHPSEHAPGHGDFPDALRASGLLERFLDRGGRHVTMANLDNLGATLDPAVVGLHADLGGEVTCEVVDKEGADRGGIPVRVDDRVMILEELRLPDSFDPSHVRVFNTNTFHFDAAALAGLDLDWTYLVVEKDVDERPAIQFERIVNEVTGALDSRYLRVPRRGASCRFLPIKDEDDLAERRPDIEAVARDRGMIG